MFFFTFKFSTLFYINQKKCMLRFECALLHMKQAKKKINKEVNVVWHGEK